MPRIPTFTSQARPTAEAPSVRTGIQISPSQNIGTALLPAITGVIDYSVKQRDVAEKVESAKKVFEIKGELDKYVEAEKENINEENAINNFQKKYKDYVDQQLTGVENNRVKQRIKQNLDLEYSEYVYNIKKNSYSSLEKESLTVVNNDITSLSAKYATTENPILKVKYKTEAKNKITQFVKDRGLPNNVLEQKLKAIDKDFLLADMNQLVGFENGVEQITKLDESLKGTSFINDEDFGQGVYSAYEKKISDLTVKGDPNSDYDRALELANQLETFQRSNGYRVKNGELSVKIDSLKEKVLTEQIKHEDLLLKVGNNKLFSDYSNDLVRGLTKSITDKGLGLPPELADEIAGAEIESQYKQRIKDYLSTNPDATLPEKKQFARELVYTLQNIYEDKNTVKNQNRILDQNRFDIEAEYLKVTNDIKLLQEGNLDPDILQQYEFRAIQQGFFDVVKDKDGKEKKEADIASFINEYLPILAGQIRPTVTGQ
jgi:hypothetical protein